MKIIFHLIKVAIGDLFRAFGLAILFGAAAAGAVLGYAYYTHHQQWPPSLSFEILAGVLGVLMGYAAATTVMLRAVSRTLLGAAGAVEKEAEKVITEATKNV